MRKAGIAKFVLAKTYHSFLLVGVETSSRAAFTSAAPQSKRLIVSSNLQPMYKVTGEERESTNGRCLWTEK